MFLPTQNPKSPTLTRARRIAKMDSALKDATAAVKVDRQQWTQGYVSIARLGEGMREEDSRKISKALPAVHRACDSFVLATGDSAVATS